MTDLKKPVKRIARGLPVSHGINPSIVLTLYPGGVLGMRESKRRKEFTLSIAGLYELAVTRHAEKMRRKCKAHKRKRCRECNP